MCMSKEKIERWSKFTADICDRNFDSLSEVQRPAVMCFWYDAEMNSGGHSAYFDCYPDTVPEELVKAIRYVANDEIAENYLKAIKSGKGDDYMDTDTAYDGFLPSLSQYLESYVEKNKNHILL